MWINKLVYKTLLSSWNEQIAAFESRLDWLHRNLTLCDERIQTLHDNNKLLRERLITAEADARASKAMRDLLVIQNAQLQEERGQFLQKVLDPEFRPAIRIPKIQTMPTVTGPGVDFEDMGDALAAQMAGADHIPVDGDEHVLEKVDDVTGLVGRVYDPASELGNELPRLGDDAMQPPEM